MKNFLKTLFGLLLGVLLLSSCSPNKHLMVERGTAIDTLHVSVSFDAGIDPIIIDECKLGVAKAIEDYNEYHYQKFVVIESDNTLKSSLKLKVVKAEIPTPGQQSGAFIGTLVGLSLPIIFISAQAPLVVFFWFDPQNVIYVTEGLSDDLRKEMYTADVGFYYNSSGGWFRSEEKNKIRAGEYFGIHLLNKLKVIGRNAAKPSP